MAFKAPANHLLQLYSVGWNASLGMLLSGLLLSPVSTENMKIGGHYLHESFKKGGGSTCFHTSDFISKNDE